MKRIVLLFTIASSFLWSCNGGASKQETQQQTDTITSITFEQKNYDFGQIVKGEVVEHTYTFENTGKVDLIIEEVDPSCGCTTPDWTKEPVKPGEKGKIKVKFDTHHQSFGNKTKQVSVYSNTTPSRNILQFTAQVVEQ